MMAQFRGKYLARTSKAEEIAQALRDRIADTGAVSVGIGGNILFAVALRKAKPAGQYQVKPEDVHLTFSVDLLFKSCQVWHIVLAESLRRLG
jgi:nucleotidyltransferase/DNA polymerase involved in DNA repair